MPNSPCSTPLCRAAKDSSPPVLLEKRADDKAQNLENRQRPDDRQQSANRDADGQNS
jgi:hypothetical protein